MTPEHILKPKGVVAYPSHFGHESVQSRLLVDIIIAPREAIDTHTADRPGHNHNCNDVVAILRPQWGAYTRLSVRLYGTSPTLCYNMGGQDYPTLCSYYPNSLWALDPTSSFSSAIAWCRALGP